MATFSTITNPTPFGIFDSDDTSDSPTGSTEIEPIENSLSVPKPSDRFTTKTLHTEVVSDYTRDYLIQHRLRNVGKSFFKINCSSVFLSHFSFNSFSNKFVLISFIL